MALPIYLFQEVNYHQQVLLSSCVSIFQSLVICIRCFCGCFWYTLFIESFNLFKKTTEDSCIDDYPLSAIIIRNKQNVIDTIMAEASTTQLKPGGYPKEIFDQQKLDPKYLCNYCELALRDPVQIFCGHRFCRSCIEAHTKSGEKCRQCEREGVTDEYSIIQGDQMFPDNAVRREMYKFQVVCLNKGCDWKGPFKAYESHEGECPYAIVRCGTCGRGVQKNMMEHHLQNECKSVNCPAMCGALVEQGKMDEHFDTTAVSKHFEAITKQLQEYGQGIPRLQEITEMLTREINHLKNKIEVIEHQLTGVVNDSSGNGNVSQNIDQKIRQALESHQGQNNEKFQQHDVKIGTFEGIVSALHREIEKTITALERAEQNRRIMKETMEQNQQKIKVLERTLAVKDVSIAELELRVQSFEFASYDGSFIWKVSDFHKKQEDAIQGRSISLYSPPFYTSRRGYKMCARLYPNGDGMGKGSHLSLFFVVMRGIHDQLLPWPFKQRVTFCLVNQNGKEHVLDSFRPDPTSTSFRRPTSDMNIASGCPLFLRLETLQNTNHGFLKEDTLFVKVMVDLNDPPLSEPLRSVDDRILVHEIVAQ